MRAYKIAKSDGSFQLIVAESQRDALELMAEANNAMPERLWAWPEGFSGLPGITVQGEVFMPRGVIGGYTPNNYISRARQAFESLRPFLNYEFLDEEREIFDILEQLAKRE